MDILKLNDVGVEPGYEGEQLREFVKTQQEVERAERREERDAVREREQLAAELKREEMRLKHEETMPEINEANNSIVNAPGPTHTNNIVRTPKFHVFVNRETM